MIFSKYFGLKCQKDGFFFIDYLLFLKKGVFDQFLGKFPPQERRVYKHLVCAFAIKRVCET